jgi:hypothetical protein
VAGGAFARIATIFLGREEVIGEEFVQRLGHFRGLLLHHLVGLGLEIAPEGFEHGLPLAAAARDVVQFLFHARREVIADIAGKKRSRKEVSSRPVSSAKKRFFSART